MTKCSAGDIPEPNRCGIGQPMAVRQHDNKRLPPDLLHEQFAKTRVAHEEVQVNVPVTKGFDDLVVRQVEHTRTSR